MRKIRLAAIVMIGTSMAVGCSSSGGTQAQKATSPAPKTVTVTSAPSSDLASVGPVSFDVHGTFSLKGPMSITITKPKIGVKCIGDTDTAFGEDYTDIAAGADVTLYDENKLVVGAGKLSTGHLLKSLPFDSRVCEFPFTITDVTPGARFYQVEIASSGLTRISEEQLREGPSLSIKSPIYSP